MNLFYNSSLSELSALIAECRSAQSFYDVIIEHDGEVLLRLSSEKTKRDLYKFKFYFKALLQPASYTGWDMTRNLSQLNQLYKNLMYCWENNLAGNIDFDEVTSIQSLDYQIIVNIAKQLGYTDVPPVFFKTHSRFYPGSAFR